MRLTFGAVEVQLQNKEQANKISQAAYKTKEVAARRYGVDSPVLNANISGDTVTFSCTGKETNPVMVESVLKNFLRQVNIPFKEKNS